MTTRSLSPRQPGTYEDLPPGLTPAETRLYERALPLLATRINDLHARISTQYLLAIIEAEGGDPRLAVPAMILHDIGWSEIPEERHRSAFGPGSFDAELNRVHEVAGARLARRLLEEQGDWEPAVVDEICRIVEGHDSRPQAESAEEAAVKDADKAWRVSRRGFPANLELLGNLTAQQVHDFIALRSPRWFLTATGLDLVRRDLAARREEYGLAPAPDVPAPAGFGIGDAEEYQS
jgi:hypothetical protein